MMVFLIRALLCRISMWRLVVQSNPSALQYAGEALFLL